MDSNPTVDIFYVVIRVLTTCRGGERRTSYVIETLRRSLAYLWLLVFGWFFIHCFGMIWTRPFWRRAHCSCSIFHFFSFCFFDVIYHSRLTKYDFPTFSRATPWPSNCLPSNKTTTFCPPSTRMKARLALFCATRSASSTRNCRPSNPSMNAKSWPRPKNSRNSGEWTRKSVVMAFWKNSDLWGRSSIGDISSSLTLPWLY